MTPAAPALCESLRWHDFTALRLSNDQIEIIVVPALGRVVHFARCGRPNWLWTGKPASSPWVNWGGDKTWLAPQDQWPAWTGRDWPPDLAWGDPGASPYIASPTPDAGLRVIGPVSTATGLRLSRDYHLDGAECVITSTVENISGPPRPISLWVVSNIDRPLATYLVPSPTSAHPSGYHPYRPDLPPLDITTRNGLLIIRPTTAHVQKLGCDTPTVAIAAQRDGEVLVQRAAGRSGSFPHGGNGVGSSVEYYDHGAVEADRFVELELLAPLVPLAPGARSALTVRWRIESVAAAFPAHEADFATLKSWLTDPVKPHDPAALS